MRRRAIVAVVLAGGLALAACGSDSSSKTSSGGNSSTTTRSTVVSKQSASVDLAETSLGKVLVDGDGLTLYLFTNDTGTTSACTGGCLAAWPPLVAKGTPTVGSGLDKSKLTTAPQAGGITQVAYNGHLLYRFATDKAPGDVNGQKVGGTWFVVDSSGNAITT